MKQFGTRATALALALLISVGPAASASVALGDDLREYGVTLSTDTNLETQIFWSNTYSTLRTEHYITYKPNEDVTPVVSYGDSILTKSTLSTMAVALQADGKRVVGGVNGDYFVVATGAPLGLVVTDGVLRSSSSYLYGAGFLADGSTIIGKPDLKMTASFSGYTLLMAGINKVRTTDGYYLFTEDFSTTTQNTQPGIDVILTPLTDGLGDQVTVNQTTDTSATNTQDNTLDNTTLVKTDTLKIGGRVTCTVDSVVQSQGSVDIPKGKMVLSINNQSSSWLVSELASLQPGDTVELDVSSSDTRWNNVRYAVGGLYKLLTGGVVESGLDSQQAPRSALGLKEDGSMVLYTIDGREFDYSLGASMTQVAQRLLELGCVEAVCLDGGGSTTIGTTMPSGSGFEILNSPSDGSERKVSNAIFLVSNLSATGDLASLYVTPQGTNLLAGAKQSLTATHVDSAYYPMATGRSVSWKVSSGSGTVDADGVFTAGAENGLAVVAAKSGVASGSASLLVVKTPSAILASREDTGASVTSLALEPGDTVSLTASALYKKMPLVSQDTCYTWSVTGTAGTVDENGLFTASEHTGSGTLTVSAGGTSVSIPVTVTGHILPLESFEGTLSSFVSTDTTAVSLSKAGDPVRYGKESLRLDYDASAGGTASAAAFLTIPSSERYLTVWVYGDGSGNTLSAAFADNSGVLTEVALTGMNYTGWKQITAALPSGTVSLSALKVIYGGGALSSGTIWLDQLTTSNEEVSDLTPPVITLSVAEGTVLASVVDNVDTSFDSGRISVTLDGEGLAFTFDKAEGIAKAALPANDGKLHRVTVTATDISGNIARSSYDIEPAAAEGESAASVFSDMSGHWADRYSTFVFDQGITYGILVNGSLCYQPEKNITRGEFFLMVARWLRVDSASYAGVKLPFDDAPSIPDWMLPGVQAMYGMGILKGSKDGSKLNANVTASITRAEAMTILGRIQPGGYALPELAFSDAGKVPSWALSYVQSLVGQGVVNGYDNLLSPSNPIKRSEVAKILFAIL